ncbi:phage holin family protein [Corynebacterium uterequi]|uniref:Putative membrane protein n=1 Tax=Corynebacterium uterequi TaxID=1072256 RepID=A0A0G3HBS9_9CORY|nr:phage holin family protein [Corynebacterium uterequi]AKK10135.1 putative membrane protein [Corynebacterium uterequi]
MRGLVSVALDVVVVAVALYAVVWLLPGITLVGDEWTFLGVAAVFCLVNAVVGPFLHTVGLPLTCLTLGLFSLVINGLILVATSWLAQQVGLGLVIDGFGWAVVGAVILGVARSATGTLTAPRQP